jgi:hypothetical protein
MIALLLVVNTIFFHYAEHWRWVDSFYFSGITMLTIGYGDLTPTHDWTKIVVVFDAMISIGLFLYSLSILTEIRMQRVAEWKLWKFPVEELPRRIDTAKKRIRKVLPSERKTTRHKMEQLFKPIKNTWYDNHLKSIEKQKKKEK